MFSELIDEIVSLSRKANLLETHIVPYANATIRECQTREFFYRDRVEDVITPTTDGSFTWDRPVRLRNIEIITYPMDFSAPPAIPRIPPSLLTSKDYYYYYGGATYFVFNGVTIAVPINISYFAYSRRFKYHPVLTDRPASYDFEEEVWTYPAGAVTDEEKEAARDSVWHWMFESWYEMIKQGTLAKVYKDVEDVRAPATYAFFQQQLKMFQASEPREEMAL